MLCDIYQSKGVIDLSGQLKAWATTIKAGLELLSGPRVFFPGTMENGWGEGFKELALDRRAWSASIRDVVRQTIPP